MNFLLSGGGQGTQTALANQKLNAIIDHAKPLLYVPLAMEPKSYPFCRKWIKNELANVNLPGIEMVESAEDLAGRTLSDYAALFIGGGNTFHLLKKLKHSGSFEKVKQFAMDGGVVFGGSAGAILFGKEIDASSLDDINDIELKDTAGFDLLNGASLTCHYTNRSAEKNRLSTQYLTALSMGRRIIALPEEDTVYVNGASIEVIGSKPYFIFENGLRQEFAVTSE